MNMRKEKKDKYDFPENIVDLKSMTDAEQTMLLRKMIERQDHDIKLSRVIAFAECALLAVLIIIFAVLIPRFFKTVNKVDSTMEQVDELIVQAQSSMSGVMVLVEDADSVITANDTAIADAIENFNSVDFDSLNESIASLAKIVKPILEVLEVFDKQ